MSNGTLNHRLNPEALDATVLGCSDFPISLFGRVPRVCCRFRVCNVRRVFRFWSNKTSLNIEIITSSVALNIIPDALQFEFCGCPKNSNCVV